MKIKIILAGLLLINWASVAGAQNARDGERSYHPSGSYGPAQYNSNKGGAGENGGG